MCLACNELIAELKRPLRFCSPIATFDLNFLFARKYARLSLN